MNEKRLWEGGISKDSKRLNHLRDWTTRIFFITLYCSPPNSLFFSIVWYYLLIYVLKIESLGWIETQCVPQKLFISAKTNNFETPAGVRTECWSLKSKQIYKFFFNISFCKLQWIIPKNAQIKTSFACELTRACKKTICAWNYLFLFS